jgi:outer membrane protein
MKRPAPIALGALLLALVGCAQGPTPLELLKQTSTSSPATVAPDADMRQLATPKTPATCDGAAPAKVEALLQERLTLCEAVELGLQNNPRLRSALASIDGAQGQEQAAFAPFLPQVDALVRYIDVSPGLSPGAPGPTGGIIPKTFNAAEAVQAELQVQWILYDFGRTAGHFGQAQMRSAVAQLQARRMRETIAFEIEAAYLQALEATAVRKIAEESIRRAEAVLEDTKARRAAGVALRDDVLRIDVELAGARDALVRAREAELAGQARLNNGMGRDASLPLVLADEPSEPVLPLALANVLQQAAEARPEVTAARDRVAAAQFGRQAAQGEFMPKLSVRGSFGRVDGQDVVTGWPEGVGIHLDLPIYHGGQRRGELRAAEAEIRRAAADAQNLLNDISLQVTLAHREATFAHERIGLARPAVIQAEETLRIVRERFRSGTATPTDVVDAQNSLTRAQQLFVTARIECLEALARLAYATGQAPERLCAPATVGKGAVESELPPPRPAPAAMGPTERRDEPVQWKRVID